MQTLLILLAAPAFAYAGWDVLGLILSGIAKRRFATAAPSAPPSSKLAILYPTSDDFDESACATMLQQEEVDFDLFILDDSTQDHERARVDAWAARQSRKITVVRREDRKGFKGGNINNWLHRFGDPTIYPFFLLVDADEHLDPSFAKTLLHRIEKTDYAFVQAVHFATAELKTAFQKILHMQVTVDQLEQLPAWNLIGLAPLIGHGVVLRTEHVKRVGGFPYVVSEDLALTIKLAEVGLYGLVASDVVGYEVFPSHYQAYWRRRRRWVQADTEMLRKFLVTIWQSNIRVLPKLYLTIREWRLPLLATYWCLCATIAVLAFRGSFVGSSVSVWWWLLVPFVLIPRFPALILNNVPLSHRLLYVITMPIFGLAASNISLPAVGVGLKGNLRFDPTGSRAVRKARFMDGWVVWDIASGVLFLVSGLVSGNLVLAAVGVAVFASPFLRTRAAKPLFVVLTVAFWLLVITSFFGDVSRGSVSLETVLLLAGLSFC